MAHRRDGNGEYGGDFSSPGDPGNPMPEQEPDVHTSGPDDDHDDE